MKSTTVLIGMLATTIVATSVVTFERQACGNDFEVCAPAGAISQTLPEVGPPLKDLYTDLIQTVDASGPASASDAGPAKRQDIIVSFCCAQGSECLLLSAYGVPFCWDHFTTNFIFPDGSYGSIVAGNYTSASGTKVDLIYGTYETKNGQVGNIYDGISSSELPNTSTMTMPTPFTSSGVGSAIPASELGTMSVVTHASSDSGATLTAITLPSLTISVGPTACSRCLSHSTGPTATQSNLTNGGRPTIIIPPISGSWKGNSPLLGASRLLAFLVTAAIFYAM